MPFRLFCLLLVLASFTSALRRFSEEEPRPYELPRTPRKSAVSFSEREKWRMVYRCVAEKCLKDDSCLKCVKTGYDFMNCKAPRLEECGIIPFENK